MVNDHSSKEVFENSMESSQYRTQNNTKPEDNPATNKLDAKSNYVYKHESLLVKRDKVQKETKAAAREQKRSQTPGYRAPARQDPDKYLKFKKVEAQRKLIKQKAQKQ